MTEKTITHIRPRRAAKLAALSISGALTPWWSPVEEACGSQYVQLTFHVSGTGGTGGTGGPVDIGYPVNEFRTGNGSYWTLHIGTNTINSGLKAMWWQKWSNAGTADVTSWSEKCVSFA